MEPYGYELLLDLHHCVSSTFSRKSLRGFFKELCTQLGMKQEKLCWWDDLGVPLEEQETEPHLKGTSAVQFIKTSNVTVHTLDLLGNVYLNIFSCKNFDPEGVPALSELWFGGEVVARHWIVRL